MFSNYGTFLGKTEYNFWSIIDEFDIVGNYNKGIRRYIINLSSISGSYEEWNNHFDAMANG